MAHVPRVYAETSVFGGVFDEEFKRASTAFFDTVQRDRFRLVTSRAVESELRDAPIRVQAFFSDALAYTELVEVTPEAALLRDAYLAAGIVGPASRVDALHIALATVNACLIVVSWNFKHIVHYQKIPRYNAINVARGYTPLLIHSPAEVILDEGQDV